MSVVSVRQECDDQSFILPRFILQSNYLGDLMCIYQNACGRMQTAYNKEHSCLIELNLAAVPSRRKHVHVSNHDLLPVDSLCLSQLSC